MRYIDRIDTVFTPAEIVRIHDALDILEETTSRLQNIRKEDMRRMAHLGLRNQGFMEEAIIAGLNHRDLLPRGFDLEAVERDRATREVLLPIAQRLQRLNALVDHSRKLMGADLYGAARAIYKALREFGNFAGLDEVLAGIGRRFEGQKRRRKHVAAEE